MRLGRATFAGETADQTPERPERPGALAVEAGAQARQRKILAGKGGPGEIGAAGQIARLERGDVGDFQFGRAPVGDIAFRLFAIEIVGEGAAPARAQSGARHAAAAEELVEGELRPSVLANRRQSSALSAPLANDPAFVHPNFLVRLDVSSHRRVYGVMSAFAFPFPVLVADIGGTNVRFAMQGAADQPLGEHVHRKTWDYPGLAEAIQSAIHELGARPASVIACGAGPVVGRTLKLTNAPWLIDGPEVAGKLGLGRGLLLNDFEAQALSLPTIPQGWARQHRPAAIFRARTQVILGPGTGLGVAALTETERPAHADRVGSLSHGLRPGDR